MCALSIEQTSTPIQPRGEPEEMLGYMDDVLGRLLSACPERLERARKIVQGSKTELVEVLSHKNLQRLAEIPQHGFKITPSGLTLEWYTRLGHSVCVAGCAIVIAVSIGLSDAQVKSAMFAGLLHDQGHSAGSHDVEQILTKMLSQNHEEIGRLRLANSPNLMALIRASGADFDSFEQAIDELGLPGGIESLADTMAYVHYDPIAYGIDIGPDIGPRIVASIVKITEDEIVVNDPAPIQVLLERRAQLHMELYNSQSNRILTHALGLLLITMHRQGDEDLWRFIRDATDNQLRNRIKAFMAEKRRALWLHDLYDCALGGQPLNHDRWTLRKHNPKDPYLTGDRFTDEFGMKVGISSFQPMFVIDPVDVWEKALFLRHERSGVIHVAKAPYGKCAPAGIEVEHLFRSTLVSYNV